MSWNDNQEDLTTYNVVINHEEQYSIWPADRELPLLVKLLFLRF